MPAYRLLSSLRLRFAAPLLAVLLAWTLPVPLTAQEPAANPPSAEPGSVEPDQAETTDDDGPPIPPAPPRAEGDGPYERLILRGVTVIDGTGAPPIGPVDVVIERNRIVDMKVVGYPGVPIDEEERPALVPEAPEEGADEDADENAEGSAESASGAVREIDLEGHYLLPGFVDLHGHIGGENQGTPAEYVFKLWMGHGITTIRDPGCGNGVDFCIEHRQKSDANEITAPRIHAYVFFGMERDEPFTQPQQAREWVASMDERGVDGFKFFGDRPDVFRAALEEAEARDLGTACHHAQLDVARTNVLHTSAWGLDTMEHWYGLPEALFTDRTVQDYPVDYNYQNEQHRFGEAGRLWAQAAERGSERWNEVIRTLAERDFTLVPTLTIYEASRDLMRARRAEWHEEYTLPALWDFYRPSRKAHGSYWFDWSTEDEVAWRNNYRKWMDFLVDYKNAGGRVATGSDSGFIYKLYGFGYVRELELLREAGFHPLEVLRAATLHGAELLGVDDDLGSVEPGKLADLVVVEANPIANWKVLYGTGAIRVDEENVPRRVGGVKYTIKDGIVYDAKAMLEDVREMVREAKDASGRELVQPGLPGDVPNLAAEEEAGSD